MRRHRFDPFSLVFGAAFLSVGLAFVTGATIGERWHSVWPMAAVITGVTLAAWAAITAFSANRTGDMSLDDASEEQETGSGPTPDL